MNAHLSHSTTLDRAIRMLASKWVVASLIAAVVLLYTSWIGYQFMRNRLYDFNVYYLAAYGFTHGYDIYGITRDVLTGHPSSWDTMAQQANVQHYVLPYLYPPLTAQLALPLTRLEVRTAGIIWLILTAVAFALSALLLGCSVQKPYGVGLAFLLLLLFAPMLTTLHAGQVNGFVLLALVVGVWGLHKGNAWLAGIGVAVGAMLKLVPVVFIGYYFLRKLWLAMIVAVGTIVVLMFSSYLTFPADTLPSYFASFFIVSRPGELIPFAPNQSLNGVLSRTLGGILPAHDIYRLYLLGVLAVVLITAVYLWPMRKLPALWRFEVGVVICAVTLITPYTWYHQLVLVFIPLFFVVEHLVAHGRVRLLIVTGGLLILTGIHGFFWHRFASIAWLTSFPCLLVLFLWLMQMAMSKRTAWNSDH
jgi:alpha-1,2-mannosyltransferase